MIERPCIEHWELTRDMQRQLAILQTQIESLIDMRSAMQRMDERERTVERTLAGVTARLTIALGLLIPMAVGLVLTILQRFAS